MMQPDNQVEMKIAIWTPKYYSATVANFTRQVVSACKPTSPNRAKALIYAVAKLAHFAETCGLTLSPEIVLSTPTIERFIATARKRLSQSTLRTVATNLRAVRRLLIDPPTPERISIPRERAKPPYSAAEIDHYMMLAAAQPTLSRKHRATALISLAAGAGLTGADLRYVRGTDVYCIHGGVVVRVCGIHPRTVPVLVRFHDPLKCAAGHAGDNLIIGGVDRLRRNITSQLVASLAGGIDLPGLDMRRLRSTWLTSAAEAIGLNAFMSAAGVDCSQRLGDIVSYLAPASEADSVRLLSGDR